MKKNIHIILVFLFFSTCLSALDKIDPSRIVGGPLERTMPIPKSSPDRTRHVTYKYKHQRGVPLAQMYRGSSHESALDAQIAAYKSKALKNLLVFGGYTKRWLDRENFQKMVRDMSSPRDLRDEFIKLEKSGDIQLRFKDGLVQILLHE